MRRELGRGCGGPRRLPAHSTPRCLARLYRPLLSRRGPLHAINLLHPEVLVRELASLAHPPDRLLAEGQDHPHLPEFGELWSRKGAVSRRSVVRSAGHRELLPPGAGGRGYVRAGQFGPCLARCCARRWYGIILPVAAMDLQGGQQDRPKREVVTLLSPCPLCAREPPGQPIPTSCLVRGRAVAMGAALVRRAPGLVRLLSALFS